MTARPASSPALEKVTDDVVAAAPIAPVATGRNFALHFADDCKAAAACGDWGGGVLMPRADVALAMVDLALDRHEKQKKNGGVGFGLFERHLTSGGGSGSVSLLAPPGSKERNKKNEADYGKKLKAEKKGGGCALM